MPILNPSRLVYAIAILTLAFPNIAGAQEKSKILDDTLRQLEKDITAARGLAFKAEVARLRVELLARRWAIPEPALPLAAQSA